MFPFYEKYDPTMIDHQKDEIMDRKVIPGLYFWALVAPSLAFLFLGIFVYVDFFFGLLLMPIIGFFGAMLLDMTFGEYPHPRHWSAFFHKRVKFYSAFPRLDHSDAGPEFKAKLTEYLDYIRNGAMQDNKVEHYLDDVYRAEEDKMLALRGFVEGNNMFESVVDRSVIDRLKIEADELRKAAR